MSESERLFILIKTIEATLPVGWTWLLRWTSPRDGYLANIYSEPQADVTFPIYASSMFDALNESFTNWKKVHAQ